MNIQYNDRQPDLWLPGVGFLHRIRRSDVHLLDEPSTILPYLLSDGERESRFWTFGPLTQNQQHDMAHLRITHLEERLLSQDSTIIGLNQRIHLLERTVDDLDDRLVNILYMMLPDRVTPNSLSGETIPRQADIDHILRSLTTLHTRMDDIEAAHLRHHTQTQTELGELYTRARASRSTLRQVFLAREIPLVAGQPRIDAATDYIHSPDPSIQAEYNLAIQTSSRFRREVVEGSHDARFRYTHNENPIESDIRTLLMTTSLKPYSINRFASRIDAPEPENKKLWSAH